MGVGSFYRFSAVRWGLAQRTVWARILTIPASGGVAVTAWYVSRFAFSPSLAHQTFVDRSTEPARHRASSFREQQFPLVRDVLDSGIDSCDEQVGKRSIQLDPPPKTALLSA